MVGALRDGGRTHGIFVGYALLHAPEYIIGSGSGVHLLLVKDTFNRMGLMASSSKYNLFGGPPSVQAVDPVPPADWMGRNIQRRCRAVAIQDIHKTRNGGVHVVV